MSLLRAWSAVSKWGGDRLNLLNPYREDSLLRRVAAIGSTGTANPVVQRRRYFSPPPWEQESPLQRQHRGILWVNALYPIKLFRFDFRSIFFDIPIEDKLFKTFPQSANILALEPRVKEGGAYVYYESKAGESPEELGLKMIGSLKEAKKRFHLSTVPSKGHYVLGTPFVEDLSVKIPSSLLKVTMRGKEMTVDELFKVFRPYGHIQDIVIPPGQSKDSPKYAMIRFDRIEGAVAARNCVHGYAKDDTSFYIDYEPVMRMNWIKEQFVKHPRIMLPLLGLLISLGAVWIFDPLRVFNIEWKLSRSFDPAPPPEEYDLGWEPKNSDDSDRLSAFINKRPHSLLVVSAPKGSGKLATLHRVLKGRKHVVMIDCSRDLDISDEDFIETLTKSIGFFPSNSLMNQGGAWMDSFMLQKGTFSQTAHTQMEKIFECFNKALRHVAKHYPHDSDQRYDYTVVVINGFLEMLKTIDNKEKVQMLVDEVFKWGIYVTQNQSLAHVVFVSNAPFASQTFKKFAEPRGGEVETYHLSELSVDEAADYISYSIKKYNLSLEQNEIKYAALKMGGRFSDLHSFIRKIRGGLTVQDAVGSMVRQAVNQIRAEGFDQKSGVTVDEASPKDNAKLKWTRSQLWESIKRLADAEYVSYDELLFTVFQGDEKALHTLLGANLLRVVNGSDIIRHHSISMADVDFNHQQDFITAFSPLYRAAFQEMVKDPKLSAGMGVVVKKQQIEEEMAKLHKIEEELLKLQSLTSRGIFGDQAEAVSRRQKALREKFKSTDAIIQKYEQELDYFQKITKTVGSFQK